MKTFLEWEQHYLADGATPQEAEHLASIRVIEDENRAREMIRDYVVAYEGANKNMGWDE